MEPFCKLCVYLLYRTLQYIRSLILAWSGNYMNIMCIYKWKVKYFLICNKYNIKKVLLWFLFTRVMLHECDRWSIHFSKVTCPNHNELTNMDFNKSVLSIWDQEIFCVHDKRLNVLLDISCSFIKFFSCCCNGKVCYGSRWFVELPSIRIIVKCLYLFKALILQQHSVYCL